MSLHFNTPLGVSQLGIKKLAAPGTSSLVIESNITVSSGKTLSLTNGNIILTGSLVLSGSLNAGEGDIYSKYFTAGAAFIGYLDGTAAVATTATTATTAINAQTASYVSANTLQNTITSGSLFLINNNTTVSGTFEVIVPSVTTQIQPSLGVNSSGVLFVGKFNSTPTAVSGGIYFDGTDFYFGI